MDERTDVVIIGAGQAGLAVSQRLTEAGVDHLVLEQGRVAETWRSRRWDSFRLVTPNWTMHLPGYAYDGGDPDGFMPLAEIIDRFEIYARSFQPPLREHTRVTRLRGSGERGFEVQLEDGSLTARSVVIATGGFQRPNLPVAAAHLSPRVNQLLSEEYTNPADLPPGAVLVMGSGQTGCQLADEIHRSGRRVLLACGRAPWIERRPAGRDVIWWGMNSRFYHRTPDMLPSPALRLVGNPQTTGHDGGRDLHFRVLADTGVELLGRFVGASGEVARFAPDLGASVAFGDARRRDFLDFIAGWAKSQGIDFPEMEDPEPLAADAPEELDLAREGINTVLWTTGYRFAYEWVEFPVFDEMGFPIARDGATDVPGLHFAGSMWLRNNMSASLMGVLEDSEAITGGVLRGLARA